MIPSFRSLALVAFATLISSVAAVPQSSSSSSTACNNSPDLCSRKYNDITHLGAHGSSFTTNGNGISAAGNQYYNATDALDAGVRLLQAQVHIENGSSLVLCHTTCSLMDAGPLDDWLTAIRRWMNSNKNDVVTLLLVNSDSASTSQFATAFETAGLDKLAYSPSAQNATSDWPTLQSMIDDNQRLVAFVTDVEASTDHAYILNEFDYVFETPFEVTELSGFNCTLDRPTNLDSASGAIQSGYMGLVNHFKYATILTNAFMPDVDNIATVNDPGTKTGNLGLHLNECKSDFSTVPNFVLVDFWNEGDVFAAVDKMNNVQATGRKTFAAGEATDSSTGVGRQQTFGTGAMIAFVAAAVFMV